MHRYSETLAALIRGERVAWSGLRVEPAAFLDACAGEGVSGLVYQKLRHLPVEDCWPPALVGELARAAHSGTAAEIVRGEEIRGVLEAFAAAGLRPVLLKGTPLAYAVYDEPGLRPRGDTDMLVRADEVESSRRVLAARGYRTTVHCDDLFAQFEVQKQTDLGIVHVFDVHWCISTQPTFAHVLTYGELDLAADPLPALGSYARMPNPLHALLLACVHPVMHHQNVERLLWIYDVHLLASRLSEAAWNAFAELACGKAMASVCEWQLRLAQRTFGTAIPESVLSTLSLRRGRERSAAYLGQNRRWHHEFVSTLRTLPGWSARARHLREVLFPSPQYLLGAYGLQQQPFGSLLLPALYVYRNVSGVWKILVGRK